MMYPLDDLRWFLHGIDGVLPTALVGALTGTLAVAFTLGTLWALRGRGTLTVPSCRCCGAQLRGKGARLPDACPECGRSLDDRRAVRWLRFRRQPATLLITAPVVCIGGVLIAFTLASAIVRSGVDAAQMRAVAAAVRDGRDEPPPAVETITVDDAGASRASRVVWPSIAELVAAARPGTPDTDDAVERLIVRVLASAPAKADSRGGEWCYSPRLARRELSDAVFRWTPPERLSAKDIASMRQLLAEGIVRRMVRPNRSLQAGFGGYPYEPNYPGLADALVRGGHLSAAEVARIASECTPRTRCVVTPQVAPGAPVGVAVVPERGDAMLVGSLRITIDGEVVVEQPERWVQRFNTPLRAGFTAPSEPGDHVVDVEWCATVSGVEWLGPFELSAVESARMPLRVARGPERIPSTRDPARDPFAITPIGVVVAQQGNRDFVRLHIEREPGPTGLFGRWLIEIDGTWRELGSSKGTHLGDMRFLSPPEGGWPETLRVRFEPDAEEDLVQRLTPGVSLMAAAYVRALDAAWVEPREFRLRKCGGNSNRPGVELNYTWSPQGDE